MSEDQVAARAAGYAPLILELGVATSRRGSPDVLEIWRVAATPVAPAGVALAAAPPAVAAESVWRADLPTDLGQATEYLDAAEARLAASEQNLSTAFERLRRFAASRPATPRGPRGGPVPAAEPRGAVLEPPERELATLLATVAASRPPDGSASIGFGPWETVASGWTEITERFTTFAEQVSRVVGQYSRVETTVDGRRLGNTIVSLTGDLDTLWSAPIEPEQAALHRRTCALTLASRVALLRRLALVSRGALTLSALIVAPGSALFTLPAAWKFLQDVLAELGGQ